MSLALADGSWEYSNSSTGRAYYILGSDGEPTDEYLVMDDEINNNNIADYKDKFSKFKWTFVWNGENYIFEKLERV